MRVASLPLPTVAPQPKARPRSLAAPLQAWRSLLGGAWVEARRECLAGAETATFATSQCVTAILRPGDREEVQGCVRIAQRFGVPLYPVSTGRNWGYGSAVPSADGCALLDLKRLDRILDYDEHLGAITVEPGVTQRQLFNFLRERGGTFWMDATGASPECSVVGNTLERGFGHTPYGDHFAQVCRLEAVLANGETIHTGLGRFGHARAADAYRPGIGPALEGLFAQSNLGIVTQMTLWLMPAPEYFQAFFFGVEHDGELEAVIDALVPLRLDGTLRSALHLGNDAKVLSSIRQYPWDEMNGRTPLDPKVLERYRKDWKIGAWNGSGALYGSRAQVAAARARVCGALKGKVRTLKFVDDRKLRWADRLSRPYAWLTGIRLPDILKLLRPVYGLLKGEPTVHPLRSLYWRKRMPPPAAGIDPHRDRCGLLWLAPVAPARGACAREMLSIVHSVFEKFPFEPAVSLTFLTERSIENVISIIYDRAVPGEDDRAMACHDRLLAELTRAGYYPYRLGIQNLGKLPPGEASYEALLRALKNTMDPTGILAPGRYLADAKRYESPPQQA